MILEGFYLIYFLFGVVFIGLAGWAVYTSTETVDAAEMWDDNDGLRS